MWSVGPIGFAAPWLLIGLLALPVLWLLLRVVPPAPIRRRFPGVALLLGLSDETSETDKTPWWLLLLRMAAVALLILGFAGPVLNPDPDPGNSGPLVVMIDGGWADAPDWPRRVDRATAAVEVAARDGRPVALVRLTDPPEAITFQTAAEVLARAGGLQPQPWRPGDLAGWAEALPEGGFETLWISAGLDQPSQTDLAEALGARGRLTIVGAGRPVLALAPAEFSEGAIQLRALRVPASGAVSVDVSARGPDPAGIERELARLTLEFTASATEATGELQLPPELRNRITRFEIAGQRSAGAVSLTDDALKRRKVALVSARDDTEGLRLLSPLHYLREALAPVADLSEGALLEQVEAKPDVIMLADIARLTEAETAATLDWVEAGGLLLRFAGPQLAASDVARAAEDPLVPVRLREGGRSVGGAMSWGDPKTLAPFGEGSPFFGLAVPDEVTVTEQVLAQPDPELADRTIAALDDGTPLVTRRALGDGQVVLFHVTANAQWSSLPLSGLFMQMLERLAVSTRPVAPGAAELAGQVWVAETVLDAFGGALPAEDVAGGLAGVPGEALAAAFEMGPDAAHPPGLYAGADRRVALNAVGAESDLMPAVWPAGVAVEGIEAPAEQSLMGPALAAGLLLLLADVLAALFLSGKLGSGAARAAGVAVLAMGLAATLPQGTQAQETSAAPTERDPEADARAVSATGAVVFAYVLTGDARVDEMSEAGLLGLGEQLWLRSAVEPAAPMGVDLERDELLFFPFLYWPVTADQPTPSDAAFVRLNAYLRTGGMILFDTRDGDMGGAGGESAEARALRRIAGGLDIPPLDIVPEDHVLTRAFYLLQDFPGRFQATPVWVEAAPADAELAEGMPFRNLNDGVTPVVIGSNDWASAWAVDARGLPLVPVGRGYAGERQREMAYRFGINLVMHVLTGNYKSDQVHVPALLERLGQ